MVGGEPGGSSLTGVGQGTASMMTGMCGSGEPEGPDRASHDAVSPQPCPHLGTQRAKTHRFYSE
ncbi:hypothetical protein HMPREF9056_00703 [Actinomyces sp. oral taxon 170 str. F0386]|nr:hypothetical protein HMPREF9056_00703 [Actinomyces sp. oral taxon 170 str. F0386]